MWAFKYLNRNRFGCKELIMYPMVRYHISKASPISLNPHPDPLNDPTVEPPNNPLVSPTKSWVHIGGFLILDPLIRGSGKP